MVNNNQEKLLIRAAEEFDSDAVYSLICLLAEITFDHDKFHSIFQKNLDTHRQIYFVAESEDRVVGFISLAIHPLLHHCGTVAEILELVVQADCRGQNIGQQLLEKVEETARKQECLCIELASNRKRERAHRFYERHGYSKTHFKLTKEL